jgi:hypothetical protein
LVCCSAQDENCMQPDGETNMLNRIACALACLIFLGNLAGCLTQAQQATDRHGHLN